MWPSGRLRRLRRRLALRPLQATLEPDEPVVAWGHVSNVDGDDGIVVLTDRRCVVGWLTRDARPTAVDWDDLAGWTVDTDDPSPLLTLHSGEHTVVVRLPTTSRARARRGEQVLQVIEQHAPAAERRSAVPRAPLQAAPRGVRGHTRRAGVTVAGAGLCLLGALFASPFLPGPGALTVLAGLALLAREYDWAQEIHHWFRSVIERLWQRQRAWRERRRARPPTPPAQQAPRHLPDGAGGERECTSERSSRQSA